MNLQSAFGPVSAEEDESKELLGERATRGSRLVYPCTEVGAVEGELSSTSIKSSACEETVGAVACGDGCLAAV